MREKFEKIPPPLQKQIIMRCGATLVSLLLMVVSLLLEGNLYLSLSVLLFFAFYGFSALQLLYRAVTDQIVVIRGHCTGLEKTPMRRRIKTLYLWSDPHAVKIQIAGRLCALPGFVDSKNEEKTERNAGYLVVSHSGGGMLRQGTRKGIRRTPANRGMRAHWVVKGLDISEDVCHGMCP